MYIQTLIKITDERMQKLSTFRGERRGRDKEEDRERERGGKRGINGSIKFHFSDHLEDYSQRLREEEAASQRLKRY